MDNINISVDDKINEKLYQESKIISNMIQAHFKYLIYPYDAFSEYKFTGVYLNKHGKISTLLKNGNEFFLVQPAPIFIYGLLNSYNNNKNSKEYEALTNFVEFFHSLSIWYNSTFRSEYGEKDIKLAEVEKIRTQLKEEKEKNNQNQVIHLNSKNQFIDAQYGLNQAMYNKWVKDSKKSYLGNIPTASLLFGDNHIQYLYPQFSKYSVEQLSEPLIGNLNANQIAKLLDSMDIYTIMSLIVGEESLIEDKIPEKDVVWCWGHYSQNDIKIVSYFGEQNEYTIITHLNGLTRLRGAKNGIKICSLPFQANTRKDSLSRIKPYHIKHIYGSEFGDEISANEILFKFLRLPVSVVLGSINKTNFGYDSNLPIDEELCDKLEQISKNKPEKYKTLSLIRK